MADLIAAYDGATLVVTWSVPYEVVEKTPDGVTQVQVLESGEGPVNKAVAYTLSDPANEIDVVAPA